MNYSIEQLRTAFAGNGEYTERWEQIDSFEDKELADKELANLNRKWVGFGIFRLTEQ